MNPQDFFVWLVIGLILTGLFSDYWPWLLGIWLILITVWSLKPRKDS